MMLGLSQTVYMDDVLFTFSKQDSKKDYFDSGMKFLFLGNIVLELCFCINNPHVFHAMY
jgi:hypothetical protein